MDKVSFRKAFTLTIPVLMGYLSAGFAFGLLLQGVGYNFIWALFMSLTVYAGTAQFLGVELLSAPHSLTSVAVMTLLINFRHLVYGLSMIEKFKGMGKLKPYMIFSLTDETYALISGTSVPNGVEPKKFYFAMALLNHIYWMSASVLGSVVGQLITFDITGVDFAMTALFVVIAVEQWKSTEDHFPAFLGAGATILFLIIVGKSQMLIVSLVFIVTVLLLYKKKHDRNEALNEEKSNEEEKEASL